MKSFTKKSDIHKSHSSFTTFESAAFLNCIVGMLCPL